MRFELTTLTLARLCSTPELRPHRLDERGFIKTGGGPQEGKCTCAKISVQRPAEVAESGRKPSRLAPMHLQRQEILHPQ